MSYAQPDVDDERVLTEASDGYDTRSSRSTRCRKQRSDRIVGRVRSDGELVQAINDGSTSAWSELVGRHTPRLWAVVRAQGLDAGSADDVVQATWIALLDHAARIRNPETVRWWLATVARHEASRVGKLVARARPTDVTDAVLGPDRVVASPEGEVLTRTGVSDVVAAIDGLPAAWAELVRLRYRLDFTYEEIHEMTGMPLGSIGPTLGRAVAALRAAIEQRSATGLSDVSDPCGIPSSSACGCSHTAADLPLDQ